MKNKDLLKQKPNVDDYKYQPYGYINALQNYIDKLEKAITVTRCCKGEAEQLFCDCEIPKPTDPYDVVDKHICRDCKQIIAK